MRRPVCQLDLRDPDLRAHGCTLVGLAHAAREMSDGAAWVDAEAFVRRMQRLSGVPLATFRARGTTLTEGRAAYVQAPGFEGRVAPRMALQRGIDVRTGLLPMLRQGRIAVVAVNHGVIVDAGKGVGTFRGGHAVVVGEPEDTHVTVADSLRHELVRWRIDLLVRAMESFGRRPWLGGRGEAAVPLPSPTFLEQRTAQRDAARRERDAARAEATLARQAVDDLRTALTAANGRIVELENAAPDCVPAVNTERGRILDDLGEWIGSHR